jgi:hypothetical protein
MAGGRFKKNMYPKGWNNHFRSRRVKARQKRGPQNAPEAQQPPAQPPPHHHTRTPQEGVSLLGNN